ncbi:hypothetical protein SAMN05421741_106108 [Paenimyroides ummariense]|uniref:MORN repeat variant n=1 Tax=Paenimyroides ummariense TaxID=913024 RepID=A0A1I4ZL78_9FLAO|nr:hypothetical protein [Paenimyroides ummariense]SFN50719.1 hypothetical protein SAMN05421741_106108 [Paenimyroides ummariense]
MSGEWIGRWKFYHKNKKLKANGNYEDGNKIGEWKYYDEQGNLIKTEKY